MNNLRLPISSSIFIILICIGLIGCASNRDRADVSDNQNSEITQISEIKISDTSQTPTDVVDTETSSLQSRDSEDTTDYSQYLKKIWIVESDNYIQYDHSSFYITKIENGVIEGKFSASSVAWPDFYFYRLSSSKYLGDLTGIINNGIAECQFIDKVGNKGNVTIVFKENDEIEATVEFINKGDAYKDENLEGSYLFRPYNLADDKEFTVLEEYSFSVDLNSWGNVNFVSGEVNTGDETFPAISLTNEGGDILYDFSASFQTDSRIIEATIEDINDDGLKDVTIVTAFNDSDIEHIKWIFFQMEDGLFYSSHLDAK